jgi:adenine deaminase
VHHREKLRLGFHIMVREGSQTRNLEALLPAITPASAANFSFCTDDKNVEDLLAEGHIDFVIRKAIARGMDPALAVRLATLNTARYFGLHHAGAVAPGYRADLAIVSDWQTCRVTRTFRNGLLTAEEGACTHRPETAAPPVVLRSTINIQKLEAHNLAIPLDGHASPRVHVIEAMENRIDTNRSIESALVRDGRVVADPSRDLCKLAVVERHRASGEIGLGLVRGFGLRRGALASSVAHDAHNLIAVGLDDADLLAALEHLVQMRGGLCVVDGGRVVADLPLPIAGLVSDGRAEQVAAMHAQLQKAAAALGCKLMQPFMALSFLSLSVIGQLKLTNQGLIDVDRFERISLFAS